MNKSQNRTHSQENESFDKTLESLKNKIISRGDLKHATVHRQLEIVSQLCEFPLGRFILDKKGANGFWTDYMISHPKKGKISGLNIEEKPFNFMESFLLDRCPVVLAHQERFNIFQKLIQEVVAEGCVLASIPCGLMRDLLDLNFSKIKNYKLIGLDIDEESLSFARKLATEKKISSVELLQGDAWHLPFKEELDAITSSGLNVYEPDPLKVLELYSGFFTALKPGGILITSVLTHPPGEDIETSWDLKGISLDDLLIDQIVHKDILDVKWRNFRSLDKLTEEFKTVGFSEVSVYFDRHKIFPTILAKKSF